ncbi:helix-turn-helix domain-containing protein, partial [Kitasatospora sp. NPDC003701]
GLLTMDDVARLGVPAATVRDWVRRGRLRKAGGTARYPRFRATDIVPLIEAWTPRRSHAA